MIPNEKLAFHGSMFMHSDWSIEEQVEACAAVGFGAYSVYTPKLKPYLAAGRTVGDLGQLLERHGLKAAAVEVLRHWLNTSDDEMRVVLDHTDRLCETARAVGCDLIVAVPYAGDEMDMGRAVANFGAACDRASAQGVRVALEFLPWTPVPDVRTAWSIIDQAGRENAGLLIDTFHFFTGPSAFEDIDGVPAERIFQLHIDDFVDEGTDLRRGTTHARRFPGEGQFDLQRFVRYMAGRGFDGYWVLEVISDAIAEQSPKESATKGMASIEALLRATVQP